MLECRNSTFCTRQASLCGCMRVTLLLLDDMKVCECMYSMCKIITNTLAPDKQAFTYICTTEHKNKHTTTSILLLSLNKYRQQSFVHRTTLHLPLALSQHLLTQHETTALGSHWSKIEGVCGHKTQMVYCTIQTSCTECVRIFKNCSQ